VTPDELKASARSWSWTIGSTVGLVALGALLGAMGMSLCHCDAFTPRIDPSPYPCHDPRMHFCSDGKTCCFDGFACIGGPNTTDPHGTPRCEYVGPDEARRLDGGRE